MSRMSAPSLVRNLASRVGSAARLVALGLLLALCAVPGAAQAQTAQTAVDKWLCAGAPGTPNTAGATCASTAGVTSIPAGLPVYYVVRVVNPTGSAMTVQLNDTYPAGFVGGTVVCTSSTSTVNQYTGPNPALAGMTASVSVPPSAGSVTCTIEGVFTMPSNQVTNTVSDIEPNGAVTNKTYNSTVKDNGVLPVDLMVTKTSSTNSIDVSGGPIDVTYTIRIKNNSTVGANVGAFFRLHDSFALMPLSVPLDVHLISSSFSCTHYNSSGINIGGDCLLPATQVPGSVPADPDMVPTATPQKFVSFWNFGAQTGHFGAGDYIEVTYKVHISRIAWINCVKAPYSDGLQNDAFFDLLRVTGTTLTELVPTNNTSSKNPPINTGVTPPHNTDSDVKVFTGWYAGDPQCASTLIVPPLDIKKDQLGPPVPRIWGSVVSYRITVHNGSTQTIGGIAFDDSVMEGLGTTTFTAAVVTCPGCPGATTGAQNYFSYFDRHTQWGAPGNIIAPPLGPTQTRVYFVNIRYYNQACSSQPTIPIQRVINIGHIRYTARQMNGTGPLYVFDQQGVAPTVMQPVPPCKFKVQKTLINGGPNVHFGVMPGGPSLTYRVTYQNLDPVQRTVGLFDAVRLTVSNYAQNLNYDARFNCNALPTTVTNYRPNGTLTGPLVKVTYTTTPAQGARIIDNGLGGGAVTFKPGATLTCIVQIWVHPPPQSNPFCYGDSAPFADLENLALMDISKLYNPNLPWAPTPFPYLYVAGASSNPASQLVNWATRANHLPRCYNFTLNKHAANPNLPPPAWTSAPGATPPVQYTITVTNVGNSPLPSGLGVNVIDFPPSAGGLSPPSHIQFFTNLLPNVGQSMTANLTGVLPVSGTPYNVKNCTQLQATGALAGPDWYAAWAPGAQPPAPIFLPAPNQICATVPVLPTRPLKMIKKVVNQTGVNIQLPPLVFNIPVTCGPYAIPSITLPLSVGPGPVANTGSIMGVPNGVPTVPVTDTCSLSENLPPVPGAALHACLGAAQWGPPIFSGTGVTPTPTGATVNMQIAGGVTVTNTLLCKTKTVTIRKRIEIAGPIPPPPGSFLVDVTCPPKPTVTVTLNSANGYTQTVPNVPLNSACTIVEHPPLVPPPLLALGCRWTVSYPASPVPNTYLVVNHWECRGHPTGQLRLLKKVDNRTGDPTVIPASFNVVVHCSPPGPASLPAALPSNGTPVTLLNPIPANSTCSVTEAPLPPIQHVHGCHGGSASWTTAYVPASVVVPANGIGTILVVNTLTCDKSGHLQIIKKVDNKTGDPGIVPTDFAMTLNCTPSGPANLPVLMQTNTSQTLPITIAANSVCSVHEQPQPPILHVHGCGGGSASWTTAYSPPSVVVPANGTATILVVNTLACDIKTGSLTVSKDVVIDSPIPPPDTTFMVAYDCGSGGPTGYVKLYKGDHYVDTVIGIPAGTKCSIEEKAPDVPDEYVSRGCHWTTTYPNGQTAVIQPGGDVKLPVVNTWTCKTRTGSLTITKDVVVTGLIGPPDTSFVVSYECNPNGPSGTVTLNKGDNYQQVVHGLVGDKECSIKEKAPGVPDDLVKQGCGWSTTYPNGDSTKILDGHEEKLAVVNTWACKTGPSGSLTIQKDVVINSPIAPPDTSFVVEYECSPGGPDGGVTLNAGNNYHSVISGLIGDKRCYVAEEPPAVPANFVKLGCHWTTSYPASQYATVASGTSTKLPVVNTWTCNALPGPGPAPGPIKPAPLPAERTPVTPQPGRDENGGKE